MMQSATKTNRTNVKIGTLANQTGLSIRTLRYYDQIGLLSPSHRTAAGHRLYTERDIARLQRVVSLRALGFSLEEIGDCIERPDFSAKRLIQMQIERLEQRMAAERRLCHRLRSIESSLSGARKITIEQLIRTIEVTHMIDKYYTPEQQEQLKRRADALGSKRIQAVEGEWKELMAEVRSEMDKGADPASSTVQALAKKWMGLVHEFTNGDPGIAASLKEMYNKETVVAGMDTTPMREMMAYIQKALAAGKK